MTIPRGGAPAPKYQRLAADLRRRIEAGEWQDGAQLPVEGELEEQYGVARNTVRLAVDVLVNEGRLVRMQGKGTYLRHQPVLDHRAHRPSRLPGQRGALADPGELYVREAALAGRQLTVEFDVMVVRARADIAELLRLPAGDAVMVRRQLRLMDREPYSIEESHYRAGLAAGTPLMEPDPVPGGDEVVLAALGRTETTAVDRVAARMPGPEEAAWFEIGPGVPLLVQTRVTHDRRGPVRVVETRYAADRCRLVFEVGDGHGTGEGHGAGEGFGAGEGYGTGQGRESGPRP
ncbi:GntR family transcriptional regulator [Kitasatospora sp. NPDC048365]|uniref:GntR family transcriptional regulator n=1 Tax=Kitasatospora sp. NPDC048365 TaxID=3364050 RepID=UPI00371678AC